MSNKFDLRKFLTENTLTTNSATLKESTEVSRAKKKVLDILDQMDDVVTENAAEVQETIFKYLELIGEDPAKLATAVNTVATLAKKDELNVRAINAFFRSESGQRLLSDKAKELEPPTRKGARDLRIELIDNFDDLTDSHVVNKATVSALKDVFQKILAFDTTIENKESFIDDISNPDKLIPASVFLEKSNSGNIADHLHEDIVTNPIYEGIRESLFHMQAKSVGKGEALLLVYSRNSGDSIGTQGDLTIEGKSIEVKNAIQRASIDTELSKAKFDIDTYNAKFQKNELGLSDEEIEVINTNIDKNGNKKRLKANKMDFQHPLIKDKLTVENLTTYFERVYNPEGTGVDSKVIKQIAKDAFNALDGGNRGVAKAVAPHVFRMYKQAKKFDALVMIKPDGSFLSFTDEIPEEVRVTDLVLAKGGDTQSLPLGYINITF